MSIISTISYVSPPGATAQVTGSPVSLLQDSGGFIFHAGRQVKDIRAVISGADSQVTLRIASDGAHQVVVQKVTSTTPTPLSLANAGGVTWAAAGTGQDVVLTAPAVAGEREYEFDASGQPAVKLKITVERQ